MDAVTLTNEELVAGGAVLGGIFGTVMVCALAFWILMIIAMWKIFSKAGEKGWKALIPIYNVYIYYKIAGMKNWFWWMIIVSIVAGVLYALLGGEINEYGQATGGSPLATCVLCLNALFALVVSIMQSARLSKAFGRGIGTTLGLIFLTQLFQLILAFGSAKYNKKAIAAKKR